MEKLLHLKLRTFITEFRTEPAALWFLCFYIFIEYIRPQGMYPGLNFLPWGETSILLCFISVFATGSRARGVYALDTMFIVISIIVILSGIFAWRPAVSLKHWTTYASWILMYFSIVSILTTPKRMILFIIFFTLINFKLSEHGALSFTMRGFSFTKWGLAGPPGWFHNSGEFSMQMVVLFSISLRLLLASKKYIKNTFRWWLLLILIPGTSALSVIGASSRGSQIALLVVMLILLLKGKYFFRKTLLLIFILYLGMQLIPHKQIERFHTMGDDQTSELRLEHWTNALITLKLHPWGIGYYNWKHYYAAHFDVIKVEVIHNTVLQAFVALGYPGGTLFLLMVITTFVMNARTKQEMNKINSAEAESIAAIAQGVNLGLLGTFISAFFMSVLFYPIFWLAFALTSALRHVAKNMEKDQPLHQKHSSDHTAPMQYI